MTILDLTALEASCRALAEALGGRWEWDGRFGAAVLAFSRPREEEVLGHLARLTPSLWTQEELPRAPEAVRTLARSFGGLQRGQRFLCSDLGAPPVLVAALWPWGDGKRTSLRIACAPLGLADEDRSVVGEGIRTWLGVEQT